MNNFVITNKGYELYSKALTGVSLNFTKLCIGSGKENGIAPSNAEIRVLDGLYSKQIELSEIQTENGAVTRKTVHEPVYNLEVLPQSANEGEYVYVTTEKKLYQYSRGVWNEKTVNASEIKEGEYFYDIASGSLSVYEYSGAVITISIYGDNSLVESSFFERELGLYAKSEGDETDALFAYAYINGDYANLISPSSNGIIKLEYNIVFTASADANIDIINAGSGVVSIEAFNKLSETVKVHIDETDRIHEGVTESLGVASLEGFDIGNIIIEKSAITEWSADENIKLGDPLSTIIAKIRRAISRVYNHGHEASDIDGVSDIIQSSVVVGEYIGNGVQTRKIELGFTPRMVEVYCPGISYTLIDNYGGTATRGVNAVVQGQTSYINSYDERYCPVSICDNGFLVSTYSGSDFTYSHSNYSGKQFIYKAIK